MKTFFEAALARQPSSPIKNTTFKMADIFEKLEKAGGPHAGHSQVLGKSRPQPNKIVFMGLNIYKILKDHGLKQRN